VEVAPRSWVRNALASRNVAVGIPDSVAVKREGTELGRWRRPVMAVRRRGLRAVSRALRLAADGVIRESR
jgi:hypothetical protein